MRVEMVRYRNVMSFKLDEALRNEILEASRECGCTASDIIRSSIRLYLYLIKNGVVEKRRKTVVIEIPKRIIGPCIDTSPPPIRKHIIHLE